MAPKLFGRSRRPETDPVPSKQFSNEQFLVHLTLQDDEKRPFYIDFYYNPKGYKIDGTFMLCHDCEGDIKEVAIIRAFIFSGTMDPQGPEFYGMNHIPQALQDANVLPDLHT